MSAAAVTELLDLLMRLHLLDAGQINESQRRAALVSDPRILAHELIDRGWLTRYQADLLLHGHGEELLLGSYVLLDKLGEGGMGTVYRARNWKLGRVCALKLIRKERLTGPDAVRRFQREIVAASQLNHVNVVRAFDADQVRSTHFFVMEFVDGVDLSRLVREHGPLPAGLACEYIRQSALGLQHAHERGLVHRDIKPANLLLTRTKGAGIIKILDMGLARHEETCSEDSATLTQVGTLMGTPDYMAPEQSVSARSVDIRADLYSLGCTLYFLLTGSVPFPGGSLAEKLLKHQTDQPRPIEMLRGDVPTAVTDIVYRLLAKKREERYQTPGELAAALAALLHNPVGQTFLSAAVARTATYPTVEPHTDPFWQSIVAEATVEKTAPRRVNVIRRWASAGGVAAAIAVLVICVIVFARSPGLEQQHPKHREDAASAKEEAIDVGVKLDPAPGPWQTLFNGKDLTGWNNVRREAEFARSSRVLEDGEPAIQIEAEPGKMTHLVHNRLVGDHQLQLEFKIPAGSSAQAIAGWSGHMELGLRMSAVRNPYPMTYLGEFRAAAMRNGELIALGKHRHYLEYSATPPEPDRWHRLDFYRLGSQGIYHLNGRPLGAFADIRRESDQDAIGKVHIMLVATGGTVHFRKIQVRKIQAWPAEVLNNPPPPPLLFAPFDEPAAKDYQQFWADHLGGNIEESNSIGMKMRVIPPGVFRMGHTADEIKELLRNSDGVEGETRIRSAGPQHLVGLSQPFFMSQCEVTQEQYQTVMGKNPSAFAASGELKDRVAGMDTKMHPVENVTWLDCINFCNTLSAREGLPAYYTIAGDEVTIAGGTGYHLPTEAQWEYACRAGTQTAYCFGDAGPILMLAMWINMSARGTTHPVGLMRANHFGLHDMHGNVEEWCQDWFAANYYETLPKTTFDPAGPATGTDRVRRGGCWYLGPTHARAGYRLDRPPNEPGGAGHQGFRIVRSGPASELTISFEVTGKRKLRIGGW